VKVLVLDNHDSFTWNLVHGIEATGGRCTVWRSDSVTLHEIEQLAPERIVLSPGPFGPERTGVCRAVLDTFGGRVPILGVCLGMQVIAAAAGAQIVASGQPTHGKAAPVIHDGNGIFRRLPSPFRAARYHSLVVGKATMPEGLAVSATAPDGAILGCRLHAGKTEGVLFHPESFLTEHSTRMFANFLEQ
jgi:anthranilate synthase/aminodeoxychorismate synthase-like glutamine amidotransferase